MGISTHILDTSVGRPASGVSVTLSLQEGTAWREVARGVTDADGRVKPLLAALSTAGVYRIAFDTGAYLGPDAFFPQVQIDVWVSAPTEHYHVPLLLNPFGYSTYRGS